MERAQVQWCLLAILIAVVKATSIDECPREVCNCPQPNGHGVVSVMNNGTADCFCDCGHEEGTACDTSEDCEVGTECAAPRDFSNVVDKSKGICTSKCMTTRCPEYHKCQMVDHQAQCVCVTYRCTDRVLNPVSAARRSSDGFTFSEVFNNICDMVNSNCHLLRNGGGLEDLWHLEHTHANIASGHVH